MDDMTAQLARQLKNDPETLRQLMYSRDGQRLMQLLTQGDRGTGLQQAVQAAARGNTNQMADMIRNIMSSPEGAALVERINKAVQK